MLNKFLENHGRVLIEETAWTNYWFYFYLDKKPIRGEIVEHEIRITWLMKGYIEKLPSNLPTNLYRITEKGIKHVSNN